MMNNLLKKILPVSQENDFEILYPIASQIMKSIAIPEGYRMEFICMADGVYGTHHVSLYKNSLFGDEVLRMDPLSIESGSPRMIVKPEGKELKTYITSEIMKARVSCAQ
jgi:hypothetical protein